MALLGQAPRSPETDYGWIRPGDELAYRSGALWNTCMMAGKVETLWSLGRRVLPNMMALFERLGDAIDTPKEPEILRTIYERMPHLNFSRDLLAHAPGDTAVMEMKGVWWSDWGSPDRIVETLTRLGTGSTRVADHLRAAAAEERSDRLLLPDEEDEEQVV